MSGIVGSWVGLVAGGVLRSSVSGAAPSPSAALPPQPAATSAPGSTLLCLVNTDSTLDAIQALRAQLPADKVTPQLQMMLEWQSGIPDGEEQGRAFFADRGWALQVCVAVPAVAAALRLRKDLCRFAADPRMGGILFLSASPA